MRTAAALARRRLGSEAHSYRLGATADALVAPSSVGVLCAAAAFALAWQHQRRATVRSIEQHASTICCASHHPFTRRLFSTRADSSVTVTTNNATMPPSPLSAVLESCGERVEPPPNAPPDAIYCRFPKEGFHHFSVGDDGSVWNSLIGKQSFGHLVRTSASASNGSGEYFDLQLHARRRGPAGAQERAPQLHLRRAHAVLIAHGHPQPSRSHTVMHRDGNTLNDALTNLQWRAHSTTEEILAHEVRVARQRGETLVFRQHPQESSLHVGNDGRIWSTTKNGWLNATEKNRVSVPESSDANRTGKKRLARDRIVWEAHMGHTLASDVFIEHVDGNLVNCHVDNLRVVSTPPATTLRPVSNPNRPDYLRLIVLEPPLESRVVTTRCDPPLDAAEGVIYARCAEPAFEHYLIGTNGTVYNARFDRWIQGTKRPRELSILLLLRPLASTDAHESVDSASSSLKPFPAALSELVLAAHGYPRPDPHAIVRHRDGDVWNCALSNLRWETTADVLEYEKMIACAAGKPELEWRQVSGFSRYWVASDGRIWSTPGHCLLSGSLDRRNNLLARVRSVENVGCNVHWSHFVYRAFHPNAPALNHVREHIQHRDGDATNFAVTNLIRSSRPKKLKPRRFCKGRIHPAMALANDGATPKDKSEAGHAASRANIAETDRP